VAYTNHVSILHNSRDTTTRLATAPLYSLVYIIADTC